MGVLACPQSLLNELQDLHEAFSIDGLLQVLFIEDDGSVEKGLGAQDEAGGLLELLEGELPLALAVVQDALADADVVGSCHRVSVGLVLSYSLVELERGLVVAEAEVAVSQGVVQQVPQVGHVGC